MEFIVVIIIIVSVLSKLSKQQKKAAGSRPNAMPPYAPSTPAPTASPTAPIPAAMPRPAMSKPFAAPAVPPRADMPFEPAKPVFDDTPHDVDSAAQGSMAAGSLAGQSTLLDQSAPAADKCDDGYGSIAHNAHEGTEFHAPGMHSASALKQDVLAGPGSLATRPVMESRLESISGGDESDALPAAKSGEDAPELMGMRLDADAMRRAVIFSEIINKRGGRHGWVRT